MTAGRPASELLRNRSFLGYLSGVVLSQIGTRGAMAATLYQVYELSGSLATTGLVGAAGGLSVVVLSPLGGPPAPRVDPRRLLPAVGQNIQVLLGPVEIAGEAEQFEQKSAALGVARIAPEFNAQRLDCFSQPALVEEGSRFHSCCLITQ